MLSCLMFLGRRPHSPTDSSRWVQSSHRSLSTWRALGHLVLPPKTTRKSRFWSNHCKMSTCKIFVPNSSKMNTCDGNNILDSVTHFEHTSVCEGCHETAKDTPTSHHLLRQSRQLPELHGRASLA